MLAGAGAGAGAGVGAWATYLVKIPPTEERKTRDPIFRNKQSQQSETDNNGNERSFPLSVEDATSIKISSKW